MNTRTQARPAWTLAVAGRFAAGACHAAAASYPPFAGATGYNVSSPSASGLGRHVVTQPN